MSLAKGHGNEEDFSRYLLRRVDEDGAEYFTVKRTGQSGMSHRGLARFVGVVQAHVSYLINKIRSAEPTNNDLTECLKPFAGKSLSLTNYFDPGGRDILEDLLCAAVVEYYANHYKPRRQGGNAKAKQAHKLIQGLGMRLFINQKTGWKPYSGSQSDNFEQELEVHKGRYSVRQILRFEDDPELRDAICGWRDKHRASRKIFSDTYDTMNTLLQGLKSREIKTNNNLPKSALIRDYYDTRPLMDYSAITRLTTNQIRCHDVHPVEAVKIVFGWLYPEHNPQPAPLKENVYKAEKRLQSEAKQRRLAEGIQLSLLAASLNPQSSEDTQTI